MIHFIDRGPSSAVLMHLEVSAVRRTESSSIVASCGAPQARRRHVILCSGSAAHASGHGLTAGLTRLA
jgi:hypothetical protein